MINTIIPLTAFTITASGNVTAYTAPSGTAVMVRSIYLTPNSSIAAATTTATIRVGPTAGMVCVLTPTGMAALTSYSNTDAFIALASAGSWAVVVSSLSANVLDFYMAGIKQTP